MMDQMADKIVHWYGGTRHNLAYAKQMQHEYMVSRHVRPGESPLEPDMTSGCASTCCQHAAMTPLTC